VRARKIVIDMMASAYRCVIRAPSASHARE